MDTNSKYKSGSGFKVPEGYFDELHARLKQIPSESKPKSRFRYLYGAIGAAAAILIGVWVTLGPVDPASHSYSIEQDDVLSFVENYDIDLYQIASTDLNVDIEDEFSTTSEEFSENELIQYLYSSELSVDELLYLSENQEL
jgi:hypothetical protein